MDAAGRIIGSGSWAAVQEVSTYAGVLQTAQVCLGVLGQLQVMRPITDRCDPSIERLKRAPESTRVDVLRSVKRRDSLEDLRHIAGTGDLPG
jgi:hypothetical protein